MKKSDRTLKPSIGPRSSNSNKISKMCIRICINALVRRKTWLLRSMKKKVRRKVKKRTMIPTRRAATAMKMARTMT